MHSRALTHMNHPEIVGFICKTCEKRLALGTCGDHREETDHKDFKEIFKENAQKMKGGDK